MSRLAPRAAADRRVSRGAVLPSLLVVCTLALASAGVVLAPAIAPAIAPPRPPVGADPAPVTQSPAPVVVRATVPWRAGERLEYDVRFGPLRVGTGSMEVVGLADVRGREAWHTTFRVHGGTVFYRVDDVLESWIDTKTLSSLRHVQDFQEGGRERDRRYEIFPDRQVYVEAGRGEQASVPNPLDEGSFLYFVRTLPLRDGESYEFHRYFRPDRNPVRIRVLRRERIRVPAGEFDAVVVQPTIRTTGIFSEGGRAEVWLSDDADRVMLQMKSSLTFGSLNLYLRERR